MYQSPDYLARHTTPTAGIIRRHSHISWRLMGAYFIAAFGIGLAVASLLLFSGYKAAVTTQMSQLRHALVVQQSAQSKTANSLSGLSAQLSSAQGELTQLAPYNASCMQDLEGQNGPTRFFFPCSSQRPGS